MAYERTTGGATDTKKAKKKAEDAMKKNSRVRFGEQDDAFKAIKKTGENENKKLESGAKRIQDAWSSFIKDPKKAIDDAASKVYNKVNEAVETAKQNSPKVTMTAEKKPEKKTEKPAASVESTLQVTERKKASGFAATKGKPVKRGANEAKDKPAARQNKLPEEKTSSAPAASKKDSPSAKTSSGKQTASTPKASSSKGGFMSQMKSNLSSKERIAKALTSFAGGKKTGKADSPAKSTAKASSGKSKEQPKAKKNKPAKVIYEYSGPFNATEAMKARRAAAEAQGKGKFNATEEMKKRRAAAEAQGKGKFNAQEEMRKRREAAQKNKERIRQAMGKGK